MSKERLDFVVNVTFVMYDEYGNEFDTEGPYAIGAVEGLTPQAASRLEGSLHALVLPIDAKTVAKLRAEQLHAEGALIGAKVLVYIIQDRMKYRPEFRDLSVAVASVISEIQSDEPRRKPVGKKYSRLRWLAQALMLRADNPEWTDKDIAEAVGISPGTLSRNKVYQSAKEAIRTGKVLDTVGMIDVDRHGEKELVIKWNCANQNSLD